MTTSKKTLTTLCLALSAVIILDSLNAGQALTAFFLAGVIPGTQHTISGSAMLVAYALIGGFSASRLLAGILPKNLFVKRDDTLSPEL